MKLPQAQQAFVDSAKVRDYLLSPSHRIGRQKARFFEQLGYTAAHWQQLRADLRRLALEHDVTVGRPSAYGRTYQMRATLTGPSGRSAEVIAIWMVLEGEDVPRLVTAFPGDRP